MTTNPANTTDVLSNSIPLCVDLDGTLVKSDSLHEVLFLLLKERPLALLPLMLAVLQGKARFKQRLAEQVELDPAALPYNEPFLEYLRQEKAAGRRLVLATASNEKFARQIAEHVNVFSEVIASDAAANVSGRAKLERLKARFGSGLYDYAANAAVDIPVWKEARAAILVNPPGGLEQKVRGLAAVTRVFDGRIGRWRVYLSAIRIHQWLKNLLVFVPLLAGHHLNGELFIAAALAFLAFSFCASSGYLVNDMLDLAADRAHARKRERPLAAGDIGLLEGGLLTVGLLGAGLAIGFTLPPAFLLLLVVYYVISIGYSLFLKRIPLVDVITLAGLYTSRVVAGGAAVSVPPSFWLLAFAMFVFLSLALVKRSAELEASRSRSGTVAGRGYGHTDMQYLLSMGVASGYLSVLVVALYINSEDVVANYSRPYFLWLICPLLLYWISRLWLKTGRGEMHHDPLVFAVRDHVSVVVALLIGGVVLAAI